MSVRLNLNDDFAAMRTGDAFASLQQAEPASIIPAGQITT